MILWKVLGIWLKSQTTRRVRGFLNLQTLGWQGALARSWAPAIRLLYMDRSRRVSVGLSLLTFVARRQQSLWPIPREEWDKAKKGLSPGSFEVSKPRCLRGLNLYLLPVLELIRLFSKPVRTPEDVGLRSSSKSYDSVDEKVRSTPSHSRSPKGFKSDQLAPQTVTPLKGRQTQGEVTSSVADTTVTLQTSLPLQDSARLSSTPANQEGTAAQSFVLSAEVCAARDSESNTVSTSQGQTPALSLGARHLLCHRTQVVKQGRVWRTAPSKPVGEITNQMHAQLQLARSPISGGVGFAHGLLPDDDLVCTWAVGA